MRKVLTILGFSAVFLAGCTPPWSKAVVNPANDQGRFMSETPTAAQLVGQLNATAQRIQGIECRDVWIEARQGRQDVSLPGSMLCQQPMNFRLTAKMVGQPAVDMGSNSQEFWWWISKSDPYLFHGNYADLAGGRLRVRMPFQPSWVMESLGMASVDPNGQFEPVRTTSSTFELIQRTTSPEGQPVRKITVFSRTQNLRVVAHRLEDMSGKEICSAQVLDIQYDDRNQVAVPRQVKFSWPAAQITMKLKLEGMVVNPQLNSERVQAAFTRPQLRSIATYDVVHGPDQPSGQVQRTGGTGR